MTAESQAMASQSAAAAERYDFRQPARLTSATSHQLGAWQRRIASLLPDKLAPHVADLACDALPNDVGRPDEVSPPHPLLAYRLRVNAEHETILALHRPLAATLVAEMLGEPQESLAEDRPLTLVEQSLIELAVADMVELLDESGTPLGIHTELLGGERRTQLIRLFNPAELVALVNFRLRGRFGEGGLCWIWPQSLLEELMDEPTAASVAPELSELAMRLPFEMVIRLGGARLSVQELAALRPGDIVVLDQAVDEPLAARVGGKEKLRVWPGREGTRQAVQIDTI